MNSRLFKTASCPRCGTYSLSLTGDLARPIACGKCGWEIHTAVEEHDFEELGELRRMHACLEVAQDALEAKRTSGRKLCRLIAADSRRE